MGKLTGITPEEAEANGELVEKALGLYQEVEQFLTDTFNEGSEVLSAEAKKLRDKFYG